MAAEVAYLAKIPVKGPGQGPHEGQIRGRMWCGTKCAGPVIQTAGSSWNLEQTRQRQTRKEDHNKRGHTGKILCQCRGVARQQFLQLGHLKSSFLTGSGSGRAAFVDTVFANVPQSVKNFLRTKGNKKGFRVLTH